MNSKTPSPENHFKANLNDMLSRSSLFSQSDLDIMTFFPCVTRIADYTAACHRTCHPKVWGFVWLGDHGRLVLKREGMWVISL